MFAELDLLGIPHRFVVGARGLAKGEVEYKHRTATESEMVSLQNAVDFLGERIGNKQKETLMTDMDKAENGMKLLKEAILETIRENPGKIPSALSKLLNLPRFYRGGGNDYFLLTILEQMSEVKRGDEFNPPKIPRTGWWISE